MAKIICTVTNDLVYDQRMIRICNALSKNYEVELIGRLKKDSPQLISQSFQQKRLKIWAQSGKWFYVEYNIRLFLYLLFAPCTVICAIDLDTILPVLWASKLKKVKRVYDAHELFCEMEEIVNRPKIYRLWKKIEQYAVPKFKHGYTIGKYYAAEFKLMYDVTYELVRNATLFKDGIKQTAPFDSYILYQGAVNEGRCFEYLIPAMQMVNSKLILCGDGNYFDQTKALIEKCQLEHKVVMKGYVAPQDLKNYTNNASIGITLFSDTGKSNYLSLANRFFDYMHSGVPQIALNYPEYNAINAEFEIAVLIDEPSSVNIANAINDLLNNQDKHEQLSTNALKCSKKYCWQEEEKSLLNFYSQLIG
jgi:glycosyltransferase involved in cell wall biosynthesis